MPLETGSTIAFTTALIARLQISCTSCRQDLGLSTGMYTAFLRVYKKNWWAQRTRIGSIGVAAFRWKIRAKGMMTLFSGAFPVTSPFDDLGNLKWKSIPCHSNLCSSSGLALPRSTSSRRFGWWTPVVVTSLWRGRGPPDSPSPLLQKIGHFKGFPHASALSCPGFSPLRAACPARFPSKIAIDH